VGWDVTTCSERFKAAIVDKIREEFVVANDNQQNFEFLESFSKEVERRVKLRFSYRDEVD
jgi:hypothetical protein